MENRITTVGSTRLDGILKHAAMIALVASLTAVAGWVLIPLVGRSFENQTLGDFTVTFYRAANNLLHGNNVYFNDYPNLNGRQYPPFNPVWILYAAVPLSVFPLHIAEVMRLALDLAGLPFLAYLAKRFAGFQGRSLVVLLVMAPWHANMIFDGNWGGLVFVGVFLCFLAAKRADGVMMGVGVWFLLLKPHIVALVILAALLYSWRKGILQTAMKVVVVLTVISSIAYPTWILDLKDAYIQRLTHPRLADSVLLLPFYPWSQIVMLLVGAALLMFYFLRSNEQDPSAWLWSVLICWSLVSALHTFVYDWLMLMFPLALILRQRWGLAFTIAVYAYPVVWAIFLFSMNKPILPPTIVPSVILVALIVPFLLSRNGNRTSPVFALK